MRCSFFRKKDNNGSLYKCNAHIYGVISEGKCILKKIDDKHSHVLLTSEQIKFIKSQSKESIPMKCRDEAYSLFITGESTKMIYELIKKSNYPNGECPFGTSPLKNYLYNRNKKDSAKYNNLTDIYDKIKEEQGLTKTLLLKTYGPEEDLKGLSFTFQEQINYGNSLPLFVLLLKLYRTKLY